ncbi:unnamed protein product [Protopolystoma xenopodis]|uniref:Uncharacterized protein n=1 Tax=Protopolystoma xenopodis TaxID=117903 RepID=A0A3S5C349_9PLAT|nr:unnamed protein product [Protopolystoma xenopodis]
MSFPEARDPDALRQSAPLPTCFAVITAEAGGGGYQVISQGTGDLLAELCTEIWDGRDIVSMTPRDRNRILDFYHRNVFSAYCTGFAYSPLLERITLFDATKNNFDHFYDPDMVGANDATLLLELPPVSCCNLFNFSA